MASKGELTRRAILDAAIIRFGREGYRTTSIADIARDAGVSGTLAYAYFPSKEALFLAAIDEDAAGVIHEGVSTLIETADFGQWRDELIFTMLAAVDRHPLARRLLAGLEPEVTARVLEIPALNELRKACAERLRREQLEGTIRTDIDASTVANGFVAIMLSLLMSVVQLGGDTALHYRGDVGAFFEAALTSAAGKAGAPRRGAAKPPRPAPTRGSR